MRSMAATACPTSIGFFLLCNEGVYEVSLRCLVPCLASEKQRPESRCSKRERKKAWRENVGSTGRGSYIMEYK